MISGTVRRPRRRVSWLSLVAVVALAVGASACGSAAPTPSLVASASAAGGYPGWPVTGAILGDPDFVPFLISSETVVGPNRLLVTVADSTQALIAAPDLPVDLRFFDLAANPDAPVAVVQGTFRWLVAETRGIYVASAGFSHAGDWGMEVVGHKSGGPEVRSRLVFSVTPTGHTPGLGTAAPPSDTLTASDRPGISLISTDANPDPTFYTLSIRQAIAAGKPFVVVFASPLLCTSATCGPALEMVKEISSAYAERVSFIHVEPYELHPAAGLHVGNTPLQPTLGPDGRPKVVAAVTEWGLPSEPYVFIVGSDGTISAKFEGVAYHDELVAALDALFP